MEERFSILYLDDEEDNLISFKAVFRRFYHVYIATNPDEAWAILAQYDIDVVISDQRMPKQTGVDFLAEVNQQYPNTVRIILTGYSDMQAVIDAINKGKIYYYISKPWKFEELKLTLDHALQTYVLKRKNEQLEAEKQALIFTALQQEKAQLLSKYEVLKNQINPHFLFNSLNTLAALIGSDPQKAIKFTTRFARMYRYLLEFGTHQFIGLEKEIELIDTYVFLQKIRFGENININYQIKDYNYSILPFALQLLVENAIKHNVVSDETPLTIEIYAENDCLFIKNQKLSRLSVEGNTGIGLKNLDQRYQLLLGKSITIQDDNNVFIVKIPLLPNI